MSKSFNEIQFNQDLTRLMEAQQPSLRLQQTVLEKMRAPENYVLRSAAQEKVLQFSSTKKVADSDKTPHFALNSRLAQVAAVLVLVLAISLIYPLLRGNWGAGATASARETRAAAAQAAPEELTMADSSPESGLMEAKMFEAASVEDETTLAGNSTENKAGDSQMAPPSVAADLILSFDNALLSLSDFPATAKRVLTINNFNPETRYFVGLPLRVETLDEQGLWQNYPLSDSAVWIALAYEIPPAAEGRPSAYTETIDFAEILENPSIGFYRIVKNIDGAELFTEFEIVN